MLVAHTAGMYGALPTCREALRNMRIRHANTVAPPASSSPMPNSSIPGIPVGDPLCFAAVDDSAAAMVEAGDGMGVLPTNSTAWTKRRSAYGPPSSEYMM